MNLTELTLTDLKKEYKDSRIPYAKLLLTEEWHLKRNEIVLRDENKCQNCQKKGDKKLNPRDKYYYRLPTKNEIEKAKLTKFHISEDTYIRAAIPAGILIKRPTSLHVHHKIYYLNEYPWESLDDELITLCKQCHTLIHTHNKIKVYNDRYQREDLNMILCVRCNGTGFLDQFEYYFDGICFLCLGHRYINLINDTQKY